MPAKETAAYEEGVREGTAMASRKRGAKGAKNTMPPMNEEEEEAKETKDMEGCDCGKKKCKGGCAKAMKDGEYDKSMKDGSCGKSMKDGAGGKTMKDGDCSMKKGRNDALTPQEYLAACDLGIQGRSRSYIRTRLDSAERLDLKCGKGSISKGEKCSKGAGQQARPQQGTLGYKQSQYGLKEQAFGRINGKVLTNSQVRKVERGILAVERRTGKAEKLTEAQRASLIATRGTQQRAIAAQMLTNIPSTNLKRSIKANENTSDPSMFAVNQVAKRELFNRRARTGARILGAGLALGALTLRPRRGDSVWAKGFAA